MISWIKSRYYAIREISNWFYLMKKTSKEESNSKYLTDSDWSKFNLRRGWIGQVYTTVNLRKEDMGEEEKVKRMKVMEKLQPINEYLGSLDFNEIVYPEITYIDKSRSWVVIYWPLFNYFKLKRLVFQSIGVLLLMYLKNKFSLELNQIFNNISEMFI